MARGRDGSAEHSGSLNLYAFVRALLGRDVSDNEIARRWDVDARVFNDLKHGRIGVPRLERLRTLAGVLGVNEHFVYAAAAGAPPKKLMALVERQDVAAAVESLASAGARAEEALAKTRTELAAERRRLEALTTELELRSAQLQTLVEQLLVAVMTLDTNGTVLHLNTIGRELFGVDATRPGVPLLVAMQRTVFLDIDGRPFDATLLPSYQALKTREPQRGVFSVHRPSRKGRLVAATATPMFAGKRFIGVVSVLRDVEDILHAVGGIGVDLPLHPRMTRRKVAARRSRPAR